MTRLTGGRCPQELPSDMATLTGRPLVFPDQGKPRQVVIEFNRRLRSRVPTEQNESQA